ncbi:hypothetical protein BGZ94_005434, partial [Podila epigama]
MSAGVPGQLNHKQQQESHEIVENPSLPIEPPSVQAGQLQLQQRDHQEQQEHANIQQLTSPAPTIPRIASKATIRMPPLAFPQTSFPAGFAPSPPSSPVTRSGPLNKSRQRRVSSVSSSHSIRQFGAYGVSPARKANPYHSGVIARYSNGNNSNNNSRHTLHNKDSSSSSLWRTAAGMLTTDLVKKDLTMESLGSFESARERSFSSSTDSAVHGSVEESVVTAEEKETTTTMATPTAKPAVPTVMFTATYEEEYNVEKDESARSSIQGSPFQSRAPIPLFDNVPGGRNFFNGHSLTPPMPKSALISGDGASPASLSSLSSDLQLQQQQQEQQAQDANRSSGFTDKDMQDRTRSVLPSPGTTWSTITGGLTEIGTITESVSGSIRTDPVNHRGMGSFDSEGDREATPSISTLSSAQVTQEYQENDMRSMERDHQREQAEQEQYLRGHKGQSWGEESEPMVMVVQRRSNRVSGVSDQAFVTDSIDRPLS